MQKLLLALVLCLILVSRSLLAASQPDLVARVVSGELREAKVSWWGFDSEDSTKFLQAAINSKVPRLTIDRQVSSWVTGPLFLESGQEIVFDEGVELLAKAGLFQGKTESLLSVSNKKNVKLTGLGKGAVLRMRKSDYHAEPYSKSEWRHGLALRSVENVTVENLSIVSSGGDGIYLGVATRGVPCRNVTFRNFVSDDNNSEIVPLPGGGGFAATGNQYLDALALTTALRGAPAMGAHTSLEMLRASFRARVLTQQTAFIVLETSEQEADLWSMQEQLLAKDIANAKKNLDEPPIFMLVAMFAVFAYAVYCSRRRRQCSVL